PPADASADPDAVPLVPVATTSTPVPDTASPLTGPQASDTTGEPPVPLTATATDAAPPQVPVLTVTSPEGDTA
ncbi:hypothetical protein NGM37_47130, partial [Streptomyces sp. TRM76130]|nr:hypothetical protein [Streptomyces sp. TRM76130]